MSSEIPNNMFCAPVRRGNRGLVPERPSALPALLPFVEAVAQRAASKLSQRASFESANILCADAQHCSHLIERVLTLVSDDERTVTGRRQPVLAVASVLEVVGALRRSTIARLVALNAFNNQWEAARSLFRRRLPDGVRSAHLSVGPTT
jgi:hypothetical protein